MTPAASVSPSSSSPSASKALHYSLWAVQVLLALGFGAGGAMKSVFPLDELAKNMAWVNDFGLWTRFVGAAEFLGAVGLIVPSLTRIMPKVTALAAAALVLVMVLAAGYHVKVGDFGHLAPSVVMGAMAAFVAWGRFNKAPIAPRS